MAKSSKDYEKIFVDAKTMYHEMKAHIDLADLFPGNHDWKHNLYGAIPGVVMWGPGYVSPNDYAGIFVNQLLTQMKGKTSEYLETKISKAITRQTRKCESNCPE